MRYLLLSVLTLTTVFVRADEPAARRTWDNRLTPIENPQPLLADYPDFFEPIQEEAHFEAPALVDDEAADLHVRAWRFSYNARGIIEMPNHLRANETAVIMVHPWAIDDDWGWKSPEPNGVADFCTPKKNALAAKHTQQVIDPFLKRMRGRAAFVMYSLPGGDAFRAVMNRLETTGPQVAAVTDYFDRLAELHPRLPLGQAATTAATPAANPAANDDLLRREA